MLPPDAGDESAAPMGGLMYQGRMQDALAQPATDGQQLPVILYLHGCRALSVAFWKLAEHYARQGYASFAPDSFARPSRRRTCPDDAAGGAWRRTVQLRHEAIAFAREQLRAFPWAKQSHVYLIGFSEGGAVGRTSIEADLRARILLGMGCRSDTRRPRPASQPTLIIKANRDPKLKGLGLCPTNRHPLSRAYEIDSDVHEITHDARVLQAIDRFLAATG